MNNEALRLAEWLDLGDDPYDKAAAAELRRLHEVNTELVEALRRELRKPAREPICVVVQNEAGQVSLQTVDGKAFHMGNYVGTKLYAGEEE